MRFLLRWLPCLVPLVMWMASMASAAEKPRVLILTDPVYSQSTTQAAKQLAPQAEVSVSRTPSDGIYHTGIARVSLEAWMGEEPWDLVVFNIGLTDLVYRAPGMKSFRVMSREAGGIRTTSAEDYRKNLTELVSHLKKTGAKVIWVNTLPIGTSLLGIHEPGSEIGYNQIAADIMAKEKVPTVDMHTFSQTLLTERELKGSIKPDNFRKKPLHPPIISAICEELSLQTPPEEVKAPKK